MPVATFLAAQAAYTYRQGDQQIGQTCYRGLRTDGADHHTRQAQQLHPQAKEKLPAEFVVVRAQAAGLQAPGRIGPRQLLAGASCSQGSRPEPCIIKEGWIPP